MKSDVKILCEKLMLADSAGEVKELLTHAGYWNMESVWRPFADLDNNFGSIGNQQSDAVSALVEKLINSIDARLMGLAEVSGVNPEQADCPQDMREAIARFVDGRKAPFGERDGNIFYWDDSKIRSEAKNISLFATGKKSTDGFPCLTISDTGEGQTPNRFPATFMSLSKNNKIWIPFVQGKFNMGGTGVFQFCNGDGNLQIQLVLSRRDPRLLDESASDRDREWGFSVIRRRTKIGMRNPMYEYLAPLNGEVLSFGADGMPIFPSDDKDRPRAYAKTATYGTMIKLYEYNTKYAKTNLTFGGSKGDSLKTKIEEALTESALPIQIVECRTHFASGRDRRSFEDEILGALTQLGNMSKERKATRLEISDPITGIVTLGGSKLPIKVYVFSEEPESDRYNPKGVFFSINGQTHGFEPPSFFTRKKINLSYIKDSLFVVVDCTHMETDIRVDLFMNSRDRMRKGAYSDSLSEELASFLGEEHTLQKLNRKRQQDRIRRSLEDQKPLEDTLRQLVKANPRLAELLPFGIKIPTTIGVRGVGEGGVGDFEGKLNPTFFRFKKNRSFIERQHPINQSVRLSFETDAVNDYFSRKTSNGTFEIKVETTSGVPVAMDYRVGNLYNGILNVVLLTDTKRNKVGEEFLYSFTTTDDSSLEPFRNSCKVKLIEAAIPHESGSAGNDSTSNILNGVNGGTKNAGLPNITPVAKDDWDTYGFREDSAVQIRSNPDSGYDFYYNKDNRDLLYSQRLGKLDPKVLDHQYKIGLMLLGLSIIDASKKPIEDEEERLITEETNIEGLVAEVTKAISPFWLSIVEALGGLKLEEAVLLE